MGSHDCSAAAKTAAATAEAEAAAAATEQEQKLIVDFVCHSHALLNLNLCQNLDCFPCFETMKPPPFGGAKTHGKQIVWYGGGGGRTNKLLLPSARFHCCLLSGCYYKRAPAAQVGPIVSDFL